MKWNQVEKDKDTNKNNKKNTEQDDNNNHHNDKNNVENNTINIARNMPVHGLFAMSGRAAGGR